MYTHCSHQTGNWQCIFSSPRAWGSAGVRRNIRTVRDFDKIRYDKIKPLCNYNRVKTDRCWRLPLFQGVPLIYAKWSNENITCSLWVSLDLKVMIYANSVMPANQTEVRKSCDGLMCHPSAWVRGYHSEQVGVNDPLTAPFKMTKSIPLYWSVILLFFSVSIFRPSLPLFIPLSRHPPHQPPPLTYHFLPLLHPNLPSRSLLILAGDWLSCNLRWTLTDECKLFFFLSLPLLSGVMKS